MKKSITILIIFCIQGLAQNDLYKEFKGAELNAVKNKPLQTFKKQNGQNQLVSIDLVANSNGPIIPPQFVYKGVVDPDAIELLADPAGFEALINGSDTLSISPDDNGKFYISQWAPFQIGISLMLGRIDYAKSPKYELRFDTDDAGLAFDWSSTGAIYKVPFTVWDINGTPGNYDDDIQMFVMTLSEINADSSWGIRDGYPSDWTLNPAQRSDRIYIYYFKDGVTYADFEAEYQTQVSTGIVNQDLWNDFRGNSVLRRITVNSLNTNLLTTINSLNGLPRPAPGTVIRWTLNIDLFFIEEDMYGVVGEPFLYKPFYTGWPPPTISTIQLPPWLNYNANGELVGTPGSANSGWNDVVLQATNTQGTVEGWYNLWVDLFPWNWIDHNNNNIVTTVFNVGKMGTMFQDIGSGFQFNGFENQLYDGELIIAKSDSQMSGGLHSDVLYNDYATKDGISGVYSPLAGFDQVFRTEYDDSRNYSPLGVKVIQWSYTKSTAPDDDYVILEYAIFNENPGMLNGIYVGLETDWDIGEYVMDLGGFDAARNLNYVYEDGGAINPNYYGTAVLSTNASGNAFTASYDDSILFTQMSSFEPPPTVTGEDRRSMIATGPYDIPPNEAVRVIFAVLGGTDLADIQANADAALSVNLNRRPALSDPPDGATGISLDPVLHWNAVFGTTSYHAQVDDDPNFTTPLVWSLSGIVNNSEQAFGLSDQTTYYWRVNATHPDGTSDWSDVWSFTTYTLPSAITQGTGDVGSVSAQLLGNVNPNGHRIAVGFEFGETNSYGNYVVASPDTFVGSNDTPVSADIYWLHTDQDYHFRVVVDMLDEQITVRGNDQMFHTGSFPTTIDLSTNISFPSYNSPSDYSASDYKIVGLPGRKDSQLDVENILSGNHKTDWQAYWDEGTYSDNSSDYLKEFDGSGDFRLGDGNAIWVIQKGNLNINLPGIQTVSLDAGENASINLHNGWNLITCPFERSIPWWEIQQVNSFSNPLYEFNDGWSDADHLTPYRGYIFDNAGNLPELIIPYQATFAKSIIMNDYNWLIKIRLQTKTYFDNSSYLGVSEKSVYEKDDFDYRKPHAVGSVPSVFFDRPGWDINYSTYATDIRPPINEIEKWEFSVSAIPGVKSELVFSEVETVLPNYEVVLLDRVNLKYLDLRKINSYQFVPVTEITNFELLVGNQEYIEKELNDILPTEYALGKNFPNPFNPNTLIPVSIPEQADIILKVYDILGKEIKTIFKGTKQTGRYYFFWDGTNAVNQQVAAGVYLYRLIINESNMFIGKMVLVK
jgi:hypothetical protein